MYDYVDDWLCVCVREMYDYAEDQEEEEEEDDDDDDTRHSRLQNKWH